MGWINEPATSVITYSHQTVCDLCQGGKKVSWLKRYRWRTTERLPLTGAD